uniref:PPPDE domain-containing protein n=1 Tax=Graphocephala atropunctata TaxID=36148 RepID=A0A1B6KCC6_9HEMI
MSEEGVPVLLFVYDLSKGLADQISTYILGTHIDGVWHTSIVVFGQEYFFSQEGINEYPLGVFQSQTVLGEPQKKLTLGYTQVPQSVFQDYIRGLGSSTFNGSEYNLLKHNCNTFSNEVSNFLVGVSIPSDILELPDIIQTTPIGATITRFLEQLTEGISTLRRNRPESPEFEQLNSAIEEARRNSLALEERRNVLNEKLARRERKNNKKKRRESKHRISGDELTPDSGSSEGSSPGRPRRRVRMADSVEVISGNGDDRGGGGKLPSEVAEEFEQEEKREREEKKKQRDPPVVFKNAVDVQEEFDALVGLIDGKMTPEEMTSLEELHQYMLEDEGSWALGDGFLNFIGRLLNDKSLSEEASVRTLNVLACAALKDDVILLLHQDRREHILMNYAFDFDRLPLLQQKALALFMCNLFENLSSSEWMLYISEWQYCNQSISNIRVTTKVAVNSLLADDPELRDRGSAIVHNLACKEVKTVVFDDVAVELSMALLQFFNHSPPEEQVFRTMKALARFCQISSQDVPQLVQMIGPPPTKFSGMSERVDEQIALVTKKLR